MNALRRNLPSSSISALACIIGPLLSLSSVASLLLVGSILFLQNKPREGSTPLAPAHRASSSRAMASTSVLLRESSPVVPEFDWSAIYSLDPVSFRNRAKHFIDLLQGPAIGAAITQVLKLDPGQRRDLLFQSMLARWGALAPADAIAFISALNPLPALRVEQEDAVLRGWVAVDPIRAWTWIAEHPAPIGGTLTEGRRYRMLADVLADTDNLELLGAIADSQLAGSETAVDRMGKYLSLYGTTKLVDWTTGLTTPQEMTSASRAIGRVLAKEHADLALQYLGGLSDAKVRSEAANVIVSEIARSAPVPEVVRMLDPVTLGTDSDSYIRTAIRVLPDRDIDQSIVLLARLSDQAARDEAFAEATKHLVLTGSFDRAFEWVSKVGATETSKVEAYAEIMESWVRRAGPAPVRSFIEAEATIPETVRTRLLQKL